MDAQFYKGRGNDVLLKLMMNGAEVNLAAITKIEFVYHNGSIDSITSPLLFETESTGIRLKFGLSAIPAGLYDMGLIIYSADHPEGVVFDPSILIRINEL
jgi:hypothetical protein